jgi:hypothetical protein
LLLAGASCHRPEEEKRDRARETVQRFFDALPGQDCGALGPLLVWPRDRGEAACPEVVGSLSSHGYRLVTVLKAEVDGRDPEAVIVWVRLEEDGKQRDAPLRVEHHPEGWKLRL